MTAKTVKVDLPAEIFDVQVNVPLIHQVVVAQQAAARQGTASTKTRAEVRGGGRKPYKQKGTGRARQGSTRAPQFAGGGIVHGPTPRSYDQRTPKKMKAAALRGALSDRARAGRIHVVESFASGDKPEITVNGIPDPHRVREIIIRLQDPSQLKGSRKVLEKILERRHRGVQDFEIIEVKSEPEALLLLRHGHLEIEGHDAESRAANSAREREGLSMEEWAGRLRTYYRTLEMLFSPDLFVVGGGISKRAEEFLPLLRIDTDMSLVDSNADGYADKVYAGDTGGQLWRFDIKATERNGKVVGSVVPVLVMALLPILQSALTLIGMFWITYRIDRLLGGRRRAKPQTISRSRGYRAARYSHVNVLCIDAAFFQVIQHVDHILNLLPRCPINC